MEVLCILTFLFQCPDLGCNIILEFSKMLPWRENAYRINHGISPYDGFQLHVNLQLFQNKKINLKTEEKKEGTSLTGKIVS